MIKTLTTASLALAALVGASLATTTSASAGGYGYGHGYSNGYGHVSTYEPVCYIKKIRVHTYYGWKIKKVRVCE